MSVMAALCVYVTTRARGVLVCSPGRSPGRRAGAAAWAFFAFRSRSVWCVRVTWGTVSCLWLCALVCGARRAVRSSPRRRVCRLSDVRRASRVGVRPRRACACSRFDRDRSARLMFGGGARALFFDCMPYRTSKHRPFSPRDSRLHFWKVGM
jgi:hypothetical protein